MTTATQFGPVDLAKHLNEPPPLEDGRRAKLEALLTECEGRKLFPNEKLAWQLLNIELHGWPGIDLSFLGMRKEEVWKGQRVILPSFSVHPYRGVEKGFRKQVFFVSLDGGISPFARVPENWKNPSNPSRAEDPTWKPERVQLAQIGFPFKEPFTKVKRFWGLGGWRKVVKEPNYWEGEERVCFSASFTGLIPLRVSEDLATAEKVFGTEGAIFLVQEATNWKGEIAITRDPLLIGLLPDKAFLIAKFDCTNLEDYVSREFTS